MFNGNILWKLLLWSFWEMRQVCWFYYHKNIYIMFMLCPFWPQSSLVHARTLTNHRSLLCVRLRFSWKVVRERREFGGNYIIIVLGGGGWGYKRWVSTLTNWKIIFILGILQQICNARILPLGFLRLRPLCYTYWHQRVKHIFRDFLDMEILPFSAPSLGKSRELLLYY